MNALALSLRKKCLGVRMAPSNTLGYPNHASWPDKLPRPGPILLEPGQLNGLWTLHHRPWRDTSCFQALSRKLFVAGEDHEKNAG